MDAAEIAYRKAKNGPRPLTAEEARERMAAECRQRAYSDLWAFVGGRRESVVLDVSEETRPVLEGFWSLVDFRVKKADAKPRRKDSPARKRKNSRCSSPST